VKLYRMFRLDPDGKPTVGTLFGMLGVRPRDPAKPRKRFDVPAVAGSDLVRPGGGGLSVFTDPAAILIQPADLALCEIDTADLPGELVAVAAGDPHYLIEPASPMTLDDYQAALAATRDFWHRV
jgi:hypothetical protein